jgi:hypothetical protein
MHGEYVSSLPVRHSQHAVQRRARAATTACVCACPRLCFHQLLLAVYDVALDCFGLDYERILIFLSRLPAECRTR